MARVELPESRLRARKRKRRLRLALAGIAALLLLCGALVGLTRLPALQIERVEVTGARTLATGTVEAFVRAQLEGNYLFLFPKRNIFLYPKQALNEALRKEYPSLASVEARAEDFGALEVALAEREPRALWCSAPGSAECYFMDEHGAVYAPAPTFSSPVYLSYAGEVSGERLPKQYVTPAQFSALAALVEALVQKLPEESAAYIAVDTVGDVRMAFVSGFTLLFTLADAGGDIFERFTLVLGAEPLAGKKLSDLEYLDLRFGDKLYYKLKAESVSP